MIGENEELGRNSSDMCCFRTAVTDKKNLTFVCATFNLPPHFVKCQGYVLQRRVLQGHVLQGNVLQGRVLQGHVLHGHVLQGSSFPRLGHMGVVPSIFVSTANFRHFT